VEGGKVEEAILAEGVKVEVDEDKDLVGITTTVIEDKVLMVEVMHAVMTFGTIRAPGVVVAVVHHPNEAMEGPMQELNRRRKKRK
jgi:hypothetical protein